MKSHILTPSSYTPRRMLDLYPVHRTERDFFLSGSEEPGGICQERHRVWGIGALVLNESHLDYIQLHV